MVLILSNLIFQLSSSKFFAHLIMSSSQRESQGPKESSFEQGCGD